MKFLFVVFFCLFFSFNNLAQSDLDDKTTEVTVEEISLARDNGDGKAGETTDKFLTTDFPIHCLIQLNSTKSVIVKMILVAIKAEGLKPETKSVSVSYKTNGNQNQVYFNASPDGVWAAGSYRADIYINGKLARSRSFEIEKSPNETEKPIRAAPKSFAPRKITKKPRKKLNLQTERLSNIVIPFRR